MIHNLPQAKLESYLSEGVMGEGDGVIPVKIELLAGNHLPPTHCLSLILGIHTYTAKSESIRENINWEYLKTHSCAVYFLDDDEDAALVSAFVVPSSNLL